MDETARQIDYEADGAHLLGYFAADGGSDPGRRRPGILVSPPGPGLGEHTKGVVRRLAEAGYAAFGLDYHGHGEVVTDGAEIAATVGFHSGLKTVRAQDARQIEGKVLVCLGADDPLIPRAERVAFEEEMRNARVDWQMD